MSTPKHKFRSLLNFDPQKDIKPKMFNQPSLTVPDQSLPLKTIMERYAKGLPIAGNEVPPMYDEDGTSTGLDLRLLDLTEIQEYAEKTKKLIADYRTGKITTNEQVVESWKQRFEKLEKQLELRANAPVEEEKP